MKPIERLAVFASFLWMIVYIAIPIWLQQVVKTEPNGMALFTLSRTGLGLAGMLIPLTVGIWLFRNAPKQNLSKWIWALFGFCFGATALILYFVYLIYGEVCQTKNGR